MSYWKNTLLVGLLGGFMFGCAPMPGEKMPSTTKPAEMPKEKVVQPALEPIQAEEGFYLYAYNGRLYVVGAEDTNAKFQMHKHLPYTKTILGEGPQGETLVIEVDKSDPDFADMLLEKYRGLAHSVESSEGFYVWKYNGRIYVIGNSETSEKFAKHKHMPYTKTLLGAGPGGETVVFEVDKKNEALAQKLITRYNAYKS